LFTGFAAALEAFWAAEQLAGLHPLARPLRVDLGLPAVRIEGQ